MKWYRFVMQIFQQFGVIKGKPVAPIGPEPVEPGQGSDVFDEINRARAQHGLEPYEHSACLQRGAEEHASYMRKAGRSSHDYWLKRLQACGYKGSENVGHGHRNATEIVEGWMQSNVGHRENVLGAWKFCGAANDDVFWCAMFAG